VSRPPKEYRLAFHLEDVIPWGRSFDEYRRMFALDDADLGRSILGCADGPASFNAEMAARGRRVVSADPLYAYSAEQIRGRVHACHPTVIEQIRRNPDIFLWNEFRDADDLGRHRLTAMETFLADYDRGRADGRYVAAALPELPFADGQFDLALCSHLLFHYSKQLSLDFHRAAVGEMLRVASEVRIFPLLDLTNETSPHVGPVCEEFRARGLRAEVITVPYEFRQGGNRMLRLSRLTCDLDQSD
jgi:SAM-dependent methyltransferase